MIVGVIVGAGIFATAVILKRLKKIKKIKRVLLLMLLDLLVPR